MKQLIRAYAGTVFIVMVVAGAMPLSVPKGWAQAQQKTAISFQVSAENTKYTQQHALDVGDMPGHQIRIFEIHRIYPKDPPLFAGVPTKESWVRAVTDNLGDDGHVVGYVVYAMQNGDKIYGRYEGTAQGTGEQPSGRRHVSGNTIFTGGTGKFRAIRGVLHNTNLAEPAKGFNESRTEGVYWMEKE